MRTRIMICFSALASVLVTLWGCSGSNNSNGGLTCTAYGCYNTAGQLVSGATGYGGVGGIILQSQGNLMVANSGDWDNFLRSSQACNTMFNSCSGADGAPGITINVQDPNFTNGYSLGNLTVLAQGWQGQGMQIPFPNLYFKQTGTGFATGVQTAPYITINPNNNTSGAMYTIYVTGSPTAANQQIAITTNGQTVATGTLVRIQ